MVVKRGTTGGTKVAMSDGLRMNMSCSVAVIINLIVCFQIALQRKMSQA